MHADLEKFLGDVWSARSTISKRGKDGYKYIYSHIYALVPSASRTAPLARDELKFLEGLGKIQSRRPAETKLKGQTTRSKAFGGASKVRAMSPKEQAELASDFYHFDPADWKSGGVSSKTIAWRVYLNPKTTRDALKMAEKILQNYVDNMTVARPTKAKVAGPRAFGRRDTIVVYTPSEYLANTIAASVGGQALNEESPELTKPVTGGVSVGMEPPSVQVFRDGGSGQSFGMYRCQIIAAALDGATNERNFKERLTTFFEIAGLDVNAPHKQARKVNLEQLNKAGVKAQRKRRPAR